MSNKFSSELALIGRLLISIMFFIGFYGKIVGYAGTLGFMQKYGVPGYLLPLVIATEGGGAILLVLGLFTRLVAFLLAGYCVIAAVLFHWDFGNLGQFINLQKNLAIAGGLLFVMIHGAGRYSLDAKLRR